MSSVNKNKKKSTGKKAVNKTIIIIKSESTAPSLFAKKVAAANALLANAKLLP